MSRKGGCIDNGAMGQAFGQIKDEFYRNRIWLSFEDFRCNNDVYVVRWNTRRRVKLKGLAWRSSRINPCILRRSIFSSSKERVQF